MGELLMKKLVVLFFLIGAGGVYAQQDAVSIDMVLVKGGTFTMGIPASDRRRFTGKGTVWPAHQVTLSDFYMGKYEVTQGQYYEVMGENPSQVVINPDNPARDGWKTLPVESVSWGETLVFCNKLSIREKLKPVYSINGSVNPDDWGIRPVWDAVKIDLKANGYRLPTESEWEYAARGGAESKGFIYAGSNDVSEVAWCDGIKDGLKVGGLHGVGKKQPNELGLYDMSGNVAEWCWDWEGNYPSDAQSNPVGPARGIDNRIIRGGSWALRHTYCMVLSRSSVSSRSTNSLYGFRVVHNAQ